MVWGALSTKVVKFQRVIKTWHQGQSAGKRFLSSGGYCLTAETQAPKFIVIIWHICSFCAVWSPLLEQIYDRGLNGLQPSLQHVAASLPAVPPAGSMPAVQTSFLCGRALLAHSDWLKARGSLAFLHAKCLILHAKWDLFFIGSSKPWYASPNTASCIAPITEVHRKSGTSPPHHTRTTKAVFIDFGNFYEAEIITNILGCATNYPILIIIPPQHLKCYFQSVT